MSRNLKLWITQSESWQKFIEFKLPKDSIARYPFLARYDDFYISLIGMLSEILNEPLLEDKKETLYILGKGLEIYSLTKTREYFIGIDYYENLLYTAALYYLADFSASACLLANILPLDNYKLDINIFISCFLRRKLDIENKYLVLLKKFLEKGDVCSLKTLIENISIEFTDIFNKDPNQYLYYKLAKAILNKFQKDNIWHSLIEYGPKELWLKYVTISLKRKPAIWSFFPSQKEAIKNGILDIDKSVTLQMPTSSGKTAICELSIYKEIHSSPDRKILFIAPYRALASELNLGLIQKLKELGIKSKAIYGGNITSKHEKEAIEYVNLLITTPEKLISIENSLGNICNKYSTIICDEGHLLDNEQRGLNYELLLSRIKSISSQSKRFIFLSAIIPNIDDLHKWLSEDNGILTKSSYRPTKLNYAFLRSVSEKVYNLSVNPTEKQPKNYILNKFLTQEDFTYINPKTNRKNTYKYNSYTAQSVAVALKSMNLGTVALFTTTKGKRGVDGLVNEVIKQLELKLNLPHPIDYAKQESIQNLSEYFSMIFGEGYLLTKLVKYGVLFHHGDLPQDVREVIEHCLREDDIKLLICTNTLAEGINLPIKTIVIHTTKRYAGEGVYKSVKIRDLQNLFGRAGRAGKETEGLIIAVNSSDFENVKKVIGNRNNEPVKGYLYYIISSITDIIKRERLILSNELLEETDEEFKQFLDSIDISIINLLSEEVTLDELNKLITELIEKTFAYYQSDNEQRNVLKELLENRSNRLRPFIENKQFYKIKRSGSNIRIFEEITEKIDFNNEIWTNTNNSLSEEWLNYIINILLDFTYVKHKLNEFNENKKTHFDTNQLFIIIKLWLQGSWYKEIAQEIQIEVSNILKLFSSFITYVLHNISSIIIKVANENLKEKLSDAILNWPSFLLYGINTSVHLDLIEIGFTDRASILEIGNWILNKGFTYRNIEELNNILIHNKDDLNYLKNKLTTISYKQTKRILEIL